MYSPHHPFIFARLLANRS